MEHATSVLILLAGVYAYVKVMNWDDLKALKSGKRGAPPARVLTDRRWDAQRFVERELHERDRKALNPADTFRYKRDDWKRRDDEFRSDIPTYVPYRYKQQRLLTGNGAQLVNHVAKFKKAQK